MELREPDAESSGDFVESPGILERDRSLQPVSESVENAVPTTNSGSRFEHGDLTSAVASVGHSIQSPTTPLFCPGPLYRYIRQFVVHETEKEHSTRLYQFPFEDDFSRVRHPILNFFVEYAMPQYSLQRIARDIDNKYELRLLRSLLQTGRNRARWMAFSLSLLYFAVVNGNIPLLDVVSSTSIDLDVRLPHEYWQSFPKDRNLVYAISGELTALQIAVIIGRQDVIEVLSERGATILTGNRGCNWRFLKDAYEQMALLQSLLSKLTASWGAATRRGIVLLGLAVRRADSKMIEVLLKAGFSPYLSLDGETDFLSIATFEQVSRKVPTPIMMALDMYREETIRLDKDPMSESRSSMITKLLSFSHHNVIHERSSQIQQVALAYAFAVLTNKHELRHTLIEETGLDEWDVMRTVTDHGWDTIKKVGAIPSPWVAPEIEERRQDRHERQPQIPL